MENKINCKVESCKHNVNASDCLLNTVSVGAPTANTQAKKDTECDSFECYNG